MAVEYVEIPTGTPVTQTVDGKKIISSDFISLLPEEVQKSSLLVLDAAAQSLWKSHYYLDDFDLPTGEIVENIITLGETQEEITLKLGEEAELEEA